MPRAVCLPATFSVGQKLLHRVFMPSEFANTTCSRSISSKKNIHALPTAKKICLMHAAAKLSVNFDNEKIGLCCQSVRQKFTDSTWRPSDGGKTLNKPSEAWKMQEMPERPNPEYAPNKVPKEAWVSPAYVHKLLRQDFKENVVDVRYEGEIIHDRMVGAVNIPLQQFIQLLELPIEQMKENYRLDIDDHNSELIIFCDDGQRSAKAWHLARRAGFTNVKLMQGMYPAYKLTCR